MRPRDLIVSAGAVVLLAGVIRGSSGLLNTNGEREVSANIVKDGGACLGVEFPNTVDLGDNASAKITIRSQGITTFGILVVTFNFEITKSEGKESVTTADTSVIGKKVKLRSTSQFNIIAGATITVKFDGSNRSEIRFSITDKSSFEHLITDIELQTTNL